MPNAFTLGQLHDLIQIVMGWNDQHMYEFRFHRGRSVAASPWCVQCANHDEHDVNDVIVKQALPRKGSTAQYLYDFGDDWIHAIKSLDSRNSERIECLAGARACPPEDSGGNWGYEDILDRLANPDHDDPDYEELLSWLGDWDPERFDLAEINQKLSVSLFPK